MSNEEIPKMGIVKQDTEDMTVYNYVDTEQGRMLNLKKSLKTRQVYNLSFLLHRKAAVGPK
jgi:hypothetical protein